MDKKQKNTNKYRQSSNCINFYRKILNKVFLALQIQKW